MVVSESGKRVRKARYWDYSEKFREKVKSSEAEIADNLLGLLENSVKRRLVGDVPIGAFLSGGIDSSSVTGIMKKHQRGDLHTFSIGFDQKSYNETDDAEQAAQWIGTIHHNKVCRINDSAKLINDALDAYDEPFADNSCIPTFVLAKLASRYVKVALSGDGADEIFAGYITYKADKYYPIAKIVPSLLRRLLALPEKNKVLRHQKKLSFGYRRQQFFYGTLHSPERAHYLWRVIFRPEERIVILGEDKRELVYDTDPFGVFKEYYEKARGLNRLDKNLYVDAMTWLADDILVKIDRACMKNSLEVRCPYLDVDLVTYAASIPADLKMRGLKSKYILKKALRGILPNSILNKKKSGFSAPIGIWLKDDTVDEFKAFNRFIFNKLKCGRY